MDTAEAHTSVHCRIPDEWFEYASAAGVGVGGDGEQVLLPLPLLWLSSPLVQFEILIDGKRVVPLTRREAAELLADSVPAYLIPLAEQLGYQTQLEAGELSLMLLAFAAADPHARIVRSRMAELRSTDREAALTYAETMLIDNYVEFGADRSAVADIVEGQRGVISTLLRRSREASQRLDATARPDDHHVENGAETVIVNPVVIHHSMLRMQMGGGIGSDEPLPVLADPAAHLEAFLDRSMRWVEDADEAVKACAEDSDRGRYARNFLEVVAKVANEWLVVVVLPVSAGQDFIIDVRYTLWTGSSLDETLGDPDAAIGAKLQHLLFWLPSKAWGLARAPLAWLTSWLGLSADRRVYTSLNTLYYPVTRGDARSYHLEVAVSHPALTLVPRSAYYEASEREYYAASIRSWAENRMRGLRRFFPNRKLDVGLIFGRVTDSSERVQHFYTTRSPDEMNLPPKKPSCSPKAGGGSLLVLRYAVPFYIVATNWVLAIGLAAIAVQVWLERIAPSSDPGGLNAADIVRLLAPLFLGTVVLFAVERHNSPVLVHKVKLPALVVLGSLVAFAAGALKWF